MDSGIRRAVLGVVVAGVVGGEAHAQSAAITFASGDDLYGYCTNQRLFYQGICSGYIVGVADALSSTSSGTRAAIAGWQACIPAGISQGQVIDVVTDHLRDHPEDRQLTAASQAAEALARAFPCR